MSDEGEKFIATLDVGTTQLKCFIFDQNVKVRGEQSASIVLEYPKFGWVEINPDLLWDQILFVIKGAVENARILPSQIKCMSVTTQRCSFLCWDAITRQPLHNIITWKDTRADELVKRWNHSFYFKMFRTSCSILHSLTKKQRYLSGSVIKFMNEQVAIRLCWVLDNVPNIREKIAKNQVKFGCLDSYIVYKMTNGEKHVTDYSNASPTGIFDPFLLTWADWALKIFDIPENILPTVVPSSGNHFGSCKIFPGIDIPILTLIADQSASLFGSASFYPGNVKVTLGTGAFLDVNTGKKPHASCAGIYPLVGWVANGETCYIAEGKSSDNGSVIEWAKSISLFKTVETSSSVAESVPDCQGVYFVPAFTGIQAPYNDTKATSGFIGITPQTKKAHMARAVLESLAFRVQQLLNVLQAETDFDFEFIRVDGGVAKNDFILQTIANLTRKRVERTASTEMTAIGCAFMAGISAGIWKSKGELEKLYKVERVFLPIVEQEESIHKSFIAWEDALERFLRWNKSH